MALAVFAHVLAWLIAPLAAVVTPGEKMYALHLGGSVLVALLVLWVRGHPSPLREMFARRIWGHPSAGVDVRFYAVNGIAGAAVFGPLVGFQHAVMTGVAAQLTALAGAREPSHAPGVAVVALVAVAAALANDFAIYLPHWLQHRVPVLWQFHKVHHSAEVLTPLTVYRFHPADDLLNLASAIGVGGSVDGLLLWAFPTENVHVTLLGVNAVLFVFYVFGVHLRHSHVWLAYSPGVSQLLISPAMHQVHHSRDPVHHGKNLGLIFSVWDRLFGTLYIPTTRLELRYGLGDGEEREFSSVRRLYWLPFVKAARTLRNRA